MATTTSGNGVDQVHKLTKEEAWQLFNAEALRYLGVSGESFLAILREGKYRGSTDEPNVIRVAMLLPLVADRK